MIISLGCRLLDISSSLPESDNGTSRSVAVRKRTASFLFGLAPGGVYQANRVTSAAGALLPHRFTLTRSASRTGGLLSAALSLTLRPVGVTDHPVL